MRTEEVNIRDPFVMVYEGKYYLYGTRSETSWGEAFGFDCYVSSDLADWEGPIEIFHRPEGFFATENYWAPECYYWKGAFYFLTTLGGGGRKKGIYLLKAKNPVGPFQFYAGPLTPPEWTCIDGTLAFEGEKIFLVYSHSFEDTPDADICVQELSADLKEAVTEPRTLFLAKEAPWAMPVPFAKAEFGMEGEVYFSDGPCVFTLPDGGTYMTWSSWGQKGSYAVGLAVSQSGSVLGPWKQQEKPLWPDNGGHGMVFSDLQGNKRFVFHYPNDKTRERPTFKTLVDHEGELTLI